MYGSIYAGYKMSSLVYKLIPIFDIYEDINIRTNFDITELAKSIKSVGLINPITVNSYYEKNKTTYSIVAGYRRYYACKKLDFKYVPCIVLDHQSSSKSKIIQLIENIQREDLTNIEYVNAVVDLWNSNIYTSKNDLAKQLGKSASFVSKCFKVDKSLNIDPNNISSANLLTISALDEVSRLDNVDHNEAIKGLVGGDITRDDLRKMDIEVVDVPEDTMKALDQVYEKKELDKISPAKNKKCDNCDIIPAEEHIATTLKEMDLHLLEDIDKLNNLITLYPAFKLSITNLVGKIKIFQSQLEDQEFIDF